MGEPGARILLSASFHQTLLFRAINPIPMFFAQIPEECSEDYSRIEVDGRTFYCKKDSSPPRATAKRRYSEQLRDPLFISKDTNRKLNMLRQFVERHKDIGAATEKYIECIEECITILNREFSIPPSVIFSAFDLQRLGIKPEDYGVEEKDESSSGA